MSCLYVIIYCEVTDESVNACALARILLLVENDSLVLGDVYSCEEYLEILFRKWRKRDKSGSSRQWKVILIKII